MARTATTKKPTKVAAQKLPRLNKTAAQYKREAFELLGIEEGQVRGVAKIEPVLIEAGVMEKVWDYLGSSGDQKAQALLKARAKLKNKSHYTQVPFEAYCVAANVTPQEAYGVISAEIFRITEGASMLLAAKAMPGVVAATIEAAQNPEKGARDRQMLHGHAGFTPTPKTSIVNVWGGKNVIGEQGKQLNHSQVAVLPPIETVVQTISDRFNERFLPAPANVIPIDGQVEVVAEPEEDEGDE